MSSASKAFGKAAISVVMLPVVAVIDVVKMPIDVLKDDPKFFLTRLMATVVREQTAHCVRLLRRG